MNQRMPKYGGFAAINSAEFHEIEIRWWLDIKSGPATIQASIPAKPLVPARLKCGGFFVPATPVKP